MVDDERRWFEVEGFYKGWLRLKVKAKDEEDAERVAYANDDPNWELMDAESEMVVSAVREWQDGGAQREPRIQRCSCHTPHPVDSQER
jgi:hypothetical protein